MKYYSKSPVYLYNRYYLTRLSNFLKLQLICIYILTVFPIFNFTGISFRTYNRYFWNFDLHSLSVANPNATRLLWVNDGSTFANIGRLVHQISL